MSDAFSATLQMIQQEGNEPSGGDDAFAQTMGGQTAAQPQTTAPINFDAPVEEVRAQIAKLPEDQRSEALKQWADTYVANERKSGGSYIGDTVRNLARGTPVGSFLDEGNAALAAAQYKLGLGGAPYDEALAYQRAQNRAVDNDSTKIGALPLIGDVTVGGATKLAGGVLSLPVTPMVNAFRGATILPQAGNAAATGAAYGALYGFGEGEGGVGNRAANAALGGTVGAGVGGAGSFAAAGLGNAVQSLRQQAVRPQIGIHQGGGRHRQAEPGAVKRVARAFRDDMTEVGRPSPRQNYNIQVARLGREGMLADMGPNMRRQAEAIANRPGGGQQTVLRAVRARDRLGQDRINDATNRALGPSQNVEELVERTIQGSQQAARPFYEQFYDTPIQMTPALRSLMNRATALVPNIDRQIAGLLRADDVPADRIGNTGVIVDYMKRALDVVEQSAIAKKDGNKARIARKLARGLMDEVDNMLSPGMPAASPWAQGRSISGRGKQFEEGVSDGSKIFSDTLTADSARAAQRRRSRSGQAGVRVGAREEVRRKMATARSAFDTQAERAASRGRQILSSAETRAKLAEVAGPQAARRLSRTLDAEGQFASTSNAIQGNSATARRLAAQQEFPSSVDQSSAGFANDLGKKTVPGLMMEYTYKLGNLLLGGALDERRLRIAQDAAELLIQRGADRDMVADELVRIVQQQAASTGQRDRIIAWINRNVRAAIPTAAGQATQPPE